MNGSDEERLDMWNAMEARKYIVHDVFLVLYFIIGVIGNTLLLVVYKTKIKDIGENRYFIPILAFADLFACILRAPFELWKTLLPVNFQDITGCQIVWFLVNVFTFSSIFILAVITFQRYLKVCRPMWPQMNLKGRRVSLVVIFLLSLGFSGPFIIWNEKLEIPNTILNVTGYICGANVIKVDENSKSFISFICFVSIVLVLVMVELIVLNTLILRVIVIIIRTKKNKIRKMTLVKMQSTKSTSHGTESSTKVTECSDVTSTDNTVDEDPSKRKDTKPSKGISETSETNAGSRKQKSFSFMFMLISLAFILSYLPQIFLLFSLIRDRYFWIKSSKVETVVFKFLDQMVMINNIVNPFVYGFFDQKFKDGLKNLLRCNR